jgi:Ca-activated chloride channel family protein
MFYSPWILLFLLILPILTVMRWRRYGSAAVTFSSVDKFDACPVSWRQRLRPWLFTVRLLCIALLIIAMARPRKGTKIEHLSTEDVAMMITVDHSGSMGEQMSYEGRAASRLEVVKAVVADFIKGNGSDYKGRMGDMVGLVTYARYADTQCPLVRGSTIIVDFLKATQLVQTREEDGTAIGDGITVAAARLQKAEEQIQQENKQLLSGSGQDKAEPDFKIKSKVIVLLTDGINNTGQYMPMEAAKLAAQWGIKIYTIGIGSETPQRRGFFDMTGPTLDEKLLKNIAEVTGGFYARADNAEQLKEIYKKIDKLEKTEVKSIEYVDYAEQFGPWAKTALALLVLEILAGSTLFRKIP